MHYTYKIAIASAAFSTAQSTKVLASALFSMLLSSLEKSSSETARRGQTQLSTMTSKVRDLAYAENCPTLDNSRDGPAEKQYAENAGTETPIIDSRTHDVHIGE